MNKIAPKLLILFLFLVGCYPYPDTQVVESDLDIVVTHFNDSTDFTTISTYILVDSIAILSEDDIQSDDPFYENELDEVVLDEIRAQMNALGYTEVFQSFSADVGIVATGLRVENTGVISTPGWWWGYPGYGYWYDPWYGSPYPYYGGGYGWYSTYYSYEKGSLVISMVDLNASEEEDTFIWTAFVNGLLGDVVPVTPDRLSRSVESAFKQSRNFYPRETN